MRSLRKNIGVYFLIALTAAAGLVWYSVFQAERFRGNLLLDVFDVGQGDAVFIQSDSGSRVLVDGGPADAVLAKLGTVLPFWDNTIDIIILTHPHADHITGLIGVLNRYRVGLVMESGVAYATPEYAEWRRLLKEKRIPVVIAKHGQRIRLSPKAELDILAPFESWVGESPTNVHDAMIISKLIYGSTTAMLMGDAEKEIEYRLLFSGDDMRASILKVGHHGSNTSSTNEFLDAVDPKIAVISVGAKNRYGHPHQDVLDRLNAGHISYFRTDIDGDLRLISDGREFAREE